MTKILTITVLAISIALNILFFVREQNFNQQLNTSISSLETQQENSDMIEGLLAQLSPTRQEILSYLRDYYPNDSQGPYSSQIVWRDYNFYFDYKDKKLDMLSVTSPPVWVCGTILGCQTDLRFEYPEFLYSSFFSNIEPIIYTLSYFVLFALFFLFLFYQIFKKDVLTIQKACLQSYTILTFGFILTMITAYSWLSDVTSSDISMELLVSSWNEIEFQFMLSLVLSVILMISGFTVNKLLSKKRYQYE